MVSEAVGAGHAMFMLESLVMLGLGGMLMLGVLLVAVEQVGHASSPGTIHPGTMSRLMALGIHAGS